MTILSKVDEATKRINQLLGDENQERFSSLLGNLSDAAGNVQRSHAGHEHHLAPSRWCLRCKSSRAWLRMRAKPCKPWSAQAMKPGRWPRMCARWPWPSKAPAARWNKSRPAPRAWRVRPIGWTWATLPGISQAASDVSSAARRMGSAAAGIGDNPQSLLDGVSGKPGPGEPGFVAPQPAP